MSRRRKESDDDSDLNFDWSSKGKLESKNRDPFSDDETEEDGSDWDLENNGTFAKSSSFTTTEESETESESAESDSNEDPLDEYGDDLIKDEEDRQKIAAMSELDREKVLYERSQAREEARVKRETKQKLRARKKQEKTQKKKDIRKRLKGSLKSRRLRVLKKTERFKEQQLMLKETAFKNKGKPIHKGADLEKSEGKTDGEVEHYLDSSKKPFKSAEKIWEATLAAIESIRISRDHLEKWVEQPFFEATTPGCFVRVSIGSSGLGKPYDTVFRLVQIIGIEKGKEYQLNGKPCNKYLKVRYVHATRKYAIKYVSNQPIKEHEFTKWKEDMLKEKVSFPSEKFVKQKVDDLHKALNYICTSEDIEKIVQEKKRMNRYRVRNFALERKRLSAERQRALHEGNFELAVKLLTEIEEINRKAREKDLEELEKHNTLSAINKRAREQNVVVQIKIALPDSSKIIKEQQKIIEWKQEEENRAEVLRRKNIDSLDLFEMHNFDFDVDVSPTEILEFKTQGCPEIPLPACWFPSRYQALLKYKKEHNLL
ncbi:RNA polymerase-associated protein RTF1 homolog [Zophobas morio]|uniref:RNA polymerase-associated protein RTF1 homolog n=1 Tax=Zophobas morio TaxID=2755281 RepID=UPI003082FBFB